MKIYSENISKYASTSDSNAAIIRLPEEVPYSSFKEFRMVLIRLSRALNSFAIVSSVSSSKISPIHSESQKENIAALYSGVMSLVDSKGLIDGHSAEEWIFEVWVKPEDGEFDDFKGIILVDTWIGYESDKAPYFSNKNKADVIIKIVAASNSDNIVGIEYETGADVPEYLIAIESLTGSCKEGLIIYGGFRGQTTVIFQPEMSKCDSYII